VAGRITGTRLAVALAATLLAAVLGLTAGGDRSEAQSGLGLARIGTFDQPVHVAHVARKRKLLYVVEQPGTIRVLRKGRRLGRPLLNIRGRVRSGGEEGLLSVAFHPRFPKNRSFFVYYTNDAGNIQVDRYRTRKKQPKSATRAKPRSRRTVISIRHPGASNHNGGQLQFGPGGQLFLATGDGGGSGDPNGNAQNRRSLLGKLLRIKPKPRGGHRSPKSNPYVGRRGRNQIFSIGLRNPWRFSFDRRNGSLWIADVGQDRFEEINHRTLPRARGANFGWNCREGREPFGGAAPVCGQRSGFTNPVHVYGDPGCAVTGGYVARGRGAPRQLRGRYVYGDFCTGDIRSLHPANPSGSDQSTGLTIGALTSFGEGRRGKLYAASRSGAVHRIVSR